MFPKRGLAFKSKNKQKACHILYSKVILLFVTLCFYLISSRIAIHLKKYLFFKTVSLYTTQHLLRTKSVIFKGVILGKCVVSIYCQNGIKIMLNDWQEWDKLCKLRSCVMLCSTPNWIMVVKEIYKLTKNIHLSAKLLKPMGTIFKTYLC